MIANDMKKKNTIRIMGFTRLTPPVRLTPFGGDRFHPGLGSMAYTTQQLFNYLASLGIAHETVTHPPLFTVEQSQALRGQISGGHSKNLFLRDKNDALFLVVALEDAAIDLKSLHHKLGAGRFSFGSPNLLRDVLGVDPGAVTPFGVINDTQGRVTVVLDTPMMEHKMLNYHPLTNTMTTAIGRDDLYKFLESTGHPPRVVQVSRRVTTD
jgi:Ala-tRNA(Pro) deacylase